MGWIKAVYPLSTQAKPFDVGRAIHLNE